MKADTVTLAALLIVLNVYDLILTRAILEIGGIEANPLMVNVISTPAGFALKVLFVAAISALIVLLASRSKPVQLALLGVVTFYAVVAASNTYVYVSLLT